MFSLKYKEPIGISSEDPETSISFYRNLFGMKLEEEDPSSVRTLKLDNIHLVISDLKKGEGTVSKHLLDHIAFRVDADSFDRAAKELSRQGAEVSEVVDHGLVRSIYFKDPDGYLVELIC
ncbi:VOC family protein [Leptospira yasudae]|uniref:VOC family protein n=1 Tax=Leptospira yasudae TaxID=2202201 RepID=A0A6N4QI01_9LEPT|nr:VOC family protein [Leptospira yasudae]TGL77192.1 VOC family protein [Leptospira yasudae]TGL80492.1 VOC family protein [Leptospira yasudae]TGL85918.1 VOC family protein [Leptospira yasudae]